MNTIKHRDIRMIDRPGKSCHQERCTRLHGVVGRATLLSSLFFLALWKPVFGQSVSCADIASLIQQSDSGFSSIQADTKNDYGNFDTTTVLPDAQYCEIIEDVEKRTYRCTWKYPYEQATVEAEYDRVVSDVANCLGSEATINEDQPVNHPDTYKSTIYTITDTELRVTFKEKKQLMSTFISIVIDG